MAIRRELHRRGFRYRLDLRVSTAIRSRPDLVFIRARVAVFVDGCFWHGCTEHGSIPNNNREWWKRKLRTNEERDVRTTTTLEAEGWKVIRIWEHELVNEAVERVAAAVTAGS